MGSESKEKIGDNKRLNMLIKNGQMILAGTKYESRQD